VAGESWEHKVGSNGGHGKLHSREWGRGDQVAVLIHGMMADSAAWWEVGPALAQRGYRVIAVDLPGHGLSPRSDRATMSSVVDSLLATVPDVPALAVGHSMGGVVLAAAAARLRPGRTVYVDTTFNGTPTVDAQQLTARLTGAARVRGLEELRRDRPWWSEEDRVVEVRANEAFDVATAVSLVVDAAGRDFTPAADRPRLMVRAEPSDTVSPDFAAQLAATGFEVRSVEGAGHTVWFGFLKEFMATLDGWA
jgi:pimeloyl-ACP methyl ester carboxylesterase